MRRLFALFSICSSLVLFGAEAPPPQPTPPPATTPSAAVTPPRPVASTPPVATTPTPAASLPAGTASVVIYPFDVQTGVDQKIGIAIAEILAQEMTAAGGLNVLAVPQAVKRPDFLQYAHQQNADFYISGYVTPVGDAAAVVEQVVSVESGVILFSQTAQVQSVADVASQSLLARAQILAFVNRATENIQTQPANTPQPTSTNGANMQLRGISSIVDSVFHHKGAPAPSPTPVVKPDRGVIVAPVTASGSVPGSDVNNATNELFFALSRHYQTQLTKTADVASSADAICGTQRNNTIASGTLTETVPAHGRTQVVFTLAIYTCFGAVLDRTVGKGDGFKQAVDAAVAAYATAHPQNS